MAEDSYVPTGDRLGATSHPRFGHGELPVDYTPMTPAHLQAGDRFGPVSFAVSRTSHEHHLAYIQACGGDAAGHAVPPLYPMEFWPLPRALSQWRFGRLNEVISLRARRAVHRRPLPGEVLLGETVVEKVTSLDGLCFGFFRSTTRLECGTPCLSGTDVLLLAHACRPGALRSAIEQIAAGTPFAADEPSLTRLATWALRMRYQWPLEKWRNNIHTDVYAQSLGYERALIEGPAVADVALAMDPLASGHAGEVRLDWKYLGPLYDGADVALVRHGEHTNRRHYTLLQQTTGSAAVGDGASRPRVLMRVEVGQ